MNGVTTIRKEIVEIIGIMPEYKLYALRPLLDLLVEKEDEDAHFVIETDLTDEERAIIAAGEKEWKEHPENFTSWEDVKKAMKNRQQETAPA
jgi:hypothetical protein